jgi:ABC-2 type transport system ATP-binding protein
LPLVYLHLRNQRQANRQFGCYCSLPNRQVSIILSDTGFAKPDWPGWQAREAKSMSAAEKINVAPKAGIASVEQLTPANAAPIVRLENVSKRFGSQEVLRGVDFVLTPSQITGLLGPSGCGKTTLVNIIVGNLVANSGLVEVLGKPAPPRVVRSAMGFMPQDEALYSDLTASENLSFFGKLYGLGGKRLDIAMARVLGLVHLQDQGRKLVASFSGGMKRRLSLAIALLHEPRLLVLDEPTVGLDPLHRLELWQTFRILADKGAALLITTHVMDEAAGCDRIVMLNDGRVIAQGSPSDLTTQSGAASLEAAFLALELLDNAALGSVESNTHAGIQGGANA